MKQPLAWKLIAAAQFLDREHMTGLAQLIHEVSRRDWAVRVLDAYGRLLEASPPQVHPRRKVDTLAPCFHLTYPVREGTIFEWRVVYGDDEDAARLAAALAVFPTLSAEKRAELGECP